MRCLAVLGGILRCCHGRAERGAVPIMRWIIRSGGSVDWALRIDTLTA
jgi:hypothetical protein